MVYKIGDKVRHCIFGDGSIIGHDGKGGVICQFISLATHRTILETFKGMSKGGKN